MTEILYFCPALSPDHGLHRKQQAHSGSGAHPLRRQGGVSLSGASGDGGPPPLPRPAHNSAGKYPAPTARLGSATLGAGLSDGGEIGRRDPRFQVPADGAGRLVVPPVDVLTIANELRREG